MNAINFLTALVITLCVNASSAVSDERNTKYEMPALMMVTWAEWPDDPKQQDVMAQFIQSNGFNSVEVEIDKLEICRRNKLYARLGDGDLNRLLKMLKNSKMINQFLHISYLIGAVEIHFQLLQTLQKPLKKQTQIIPQCSSIEPTGMNSMNSLIKLSQCF